MTGHSSGRGPTDEGPRDGRAVDPPAEATDPGLGASRQPGPSRDDGSIEAAQIPLHPDEVVPPTGQATGAGGGYGVGSGRGSSGGSGDGAEASSPTGSDPETEWLRSETTGDGR